MQGKLDDLMITTRDGALLRYVDISDWDIWAIPEHVKGRDESEHLTETRYAAAVLVDSNDQQVADPCNDEAVKALGKRIKLGDRRRVVLHCFERIDVIAAQIKKNRDSTMKNDSGDGSPSNGSAQSTLSESVGG